jgi:hypothetical protein
MGRAGREAQRRRVIGPSPHHTLDRRGGPHRLSGVTKDMAVSDTKLAIESYTINFGLRTVSLDDVRDIVPYHEIGLICTAAGAQMHVTLELWTDLRHLAPTEVGFYDSFKQTITIKAPLSEFDRIRSLLRHDKPLFLVFNQLEVGGSHHPEIKSISSASFVTESEPVGTSE